MKGIMIILLLILISACSCASPCEPKQDLINKCSRYKKGASCTWEVGIFLKYTCVCRCK